MMGRDARLPKLPTPFEVADAGLDSIAEVIKLPGRIISSIARGVGDAADGFNAGVGKPQSYAEVPAPPDVVLSGAVDSATGVVNGLIRSVTGAINSIVQTGEGVRSEIDQIVRR